MRDFRQERGSGAGGAVSLEDLEKDAGALYGAIQEARAPQTSPASRRALVRLGKTLGARIARKCLEIERASD